MKKKLSSSQMEKKSSEFGQCTLSVKILQPSEFTIIHFPISFVCHKYKRQKERHDGCS